MEDDIREYIEPAGKTVEDAITNATVKLSVTTDKLEYVVVDKGSAGFLGINRKPAIIKARVKDEIDEFEQAIKGNVPEPKKDTKPVKKAEPKPENKPVYNKPQAPKTEVKAENKPETKQETKTEIKSEVKKEIKAEAVEYGYQDEEFERPSKKAVAGPNMEPAIKKFLGDVLNAMNMEAEVKVSINEKDSTVDVELVGNNMGVLIGKRGQTLDSLQYLVSLVANKESEGYFRVKLDTENYRARRKETLESLAKNIAYKVKRTRKAVSLEPMNPYERRIIHSALQNDKYVATKSEGEEPFRHVVVYLKRNV